jgi:hypothetical protein
VANSQPPICLRLAARLGGGFLFPSRLTNGSSEKIENRRHLLTIHFIQSNSCRIRQTLRVTPAMKACLTDQIWTLEEIVDLIGGE